MSNSFCKFFNNGLVYNLGNDTFTMSPCCYFKQNFYADVNLSSVEQYEKFKSVWSSADTETNCNTCNLQEKGNQVSYRQAANDIVKKDTDKLVMLTIAVNKKCNLACPTCSAESSSFWYQENIRNNVKQSNTIKITHQEDKQHIITEKFLKFFKEVDLSDIEYIKFGGGEPFMNDTHIKILELLPNKQNITVQYTSNFSIMPSDNIFKVWEKFKLIKWMASVDGTESQFEFLRWPYKWEKFSDFCKTAVLSVPTNVMFGVEHTINPLNAFYYDRFEQWFYQEFGSNRLGDASDLNLHFAEGILGLSNTPIRLKNLIIEKYGENHLISNFLQTTNTPSYQLTEVVEYLNNLNSWRKVSWQQIFPEIQEYIS